TKTVSVAEVTVGGSATFTLTAANIGTGPATGVVAVDTLPVGMTPTLLPAGMTYNAGTRQLTWTIGDLAAGASVSVEYTVTVSSAGTLVNVVVVTSETPGDP
ncbi:MAG TPA: DUF11 domain-containing protein, partial [Ilumatobacteraceae bacterium]|nr:DUF11 domain-containing protein [Ilumatobacteraceae bacterium]